MLKGQIMVQVFEYHESCGFYLERWEDVDQKSFTGKWRIYDSGEIHLEYIDGNGFYKFIGEDQIRFYEDYCHV